jgi:hypothetical protein
MASATFHGGGYDRMVNNYLYLPPLRLADTILRKSVHTTISAPTIEAEYILIKHNYYCLSVG